MPASSVKCTTRRCGARVMGVNNVAGANPGLSRGALLGFALDTSVETEGGLSVCMGPLE